MKLMLSLVVAALAAALVSCGASSAEIKAAREAKYKGDPAAMFADVKKVIAIDYKTEAEDPAALMVKTQPRWYTPDGQADQTRGNNLARLQDGSINFSVGVRLAKVDGDLYIVEVEPVALRMRGLVSKAEPLDMKDPDVPGWVHGKVESLQINLHKQLEGYQVKGATVPAAIPPAPAPAPAPAADPAAGSAAEPAPAAPPATP